MLPARKDQAPPDPALAAQAHRIDALLRLWETEDISDEPDWDVKDIERIRFAGPVVRDGDSELP